jgi:hypothetical protein
MNGDSRDLPGSEAEFTLRRSLSLGLYAVAGALVAGWLTLAIFHLGDDYHVTHVQGVWIAAAEAARVGQLYPPLFDGEHYAGTRYLPLPVLLNALASTIVGDPVTGGKLLALVLMLVLLVLVTTILRDLRCSWSLAGALAAIVVGTQVGLQAGTTIGGDLLPVVLQTAALGLVMRPRSLLTLVVAGGLAGLAIASKLTGLWAFFGITTWLLLQRKWSQAATFGLVSVGTGTIVLGAVQLLTVGGLVDHVRAFAVAGIHQSWFLLRGPNRLLYNLLGSASGTVVMLPFAVLGAFLVARREDLSVIHLSLGYALLLLLVVYADIGTGSNQLLDLVVLVVLGAGHLAGQTAGPDGRNRMLTPLQVAVAVAAIWAAGLDLVRTQGVDLRAAVAASKAEGPHERATNLIADLVGPGDDVLAEDPSVYVALRRRPLLMDAFMLARLDRARPEWVDPLIARITDRQFDLVVLVVPLQDETLEFWWTDFHLGPRVAAALRRTYRADGQVGRFYLYRPL